MKKHFKKLYATLATGMVVFTGCFSSQYIMPPADLSESDKGPMAVLANDGTIYSLNYGVVTTNQVAGRGFRYTVEGEIDSSFWSIPMSEIELVQTSRPDIVKSLLITGTVGVLVGTAIAATNGPNDAEGSAEVQLVRPYSGGGGGEGGCPLVFAFDGEDYHLESETFAGAVCQSLEYTNIERLHHLGEVNGAYHLVIANQQPESHFVNELALVAVDHPRGTQVIPDIHGQVRTVRLLVPATSAWSLDGRDATESVRIADGRMWESELEAVNLSLDENLRDGLVCAFAKPKGATQAKLVITGKNTTLGNYALETMFSQGEADRLRWLHQLNTNTAEQEKYTGWIIREGGLEISVLTNGNWVKQGWFPNVGPIVTAEKIISLDIRGETADSIWVKIETARDLWLIDRIAIDFSEDEQVTVMPLPLRSAITESGVDVTHLLATSDSLYYRSLYGEYAQLVYETVARNPEMERSIVMKSRGYYYRWARSNEDEVSREMVERVLTEPLYGNRILLPRWREVKAQHANAGSSMPCFGRN
jgi:hypothetical protein